MIPLLTTKCMCRLGNAAAVACLSPLLSCSRDLSSLVETPRHFILLAALVWARNVPANVVERFDEQNEGGKHDLVYVAEDDGKILVLYWADPSRIHTLLWSTLASIVDGQLATALGGIFQSSGRRAGN